jgi:hypothetical protein
MAGAPIGNQNAAKPLMWRAAINRALEKRSRVAGREALDDLAEKLIELAEQSDLAALKELGDRLDGKPAQMVGIGQDPNAEPAQITRVERVVLGGNP